MYVIGLGAAGCNLARCFNKFPEYNMIRIDTNKDADIKIKQEKSHEDYEKNFPSISEVAGIRDADIFVICAGAGRISGGILRLLNQLQNNNVRVLYIQSDLELMSEIQKKQERIVFNVLQEYARSGMIEQILLIDNVALDRGLGDLPIIGYYEILNQAIVNTIHMINIFANSEPVIGTFMEQSEISRIATIGIVDIENKEEKWFFNLTSPRDVVYYYGINEEALKTDGTLFKTITNYVKSRQKDNINISYGVFKTLYEQKFCYCMKFSSVVQSL